MALNLSIILKRVIKMKKRITLAVNEDSNIVSVVEGNLIETTEQYSYWMTKKGIVVTLPYRHPVNSNLISTSIIDEMEEYYTPLNEHSINCDELQVIEETCSWAVAAALTSNH
jgi:hypothetical protein